MSIPSLHASSNVLSGTYMTSANASYYVPIGNCISYYSNTTESLAQYTERFTGTYSKLYILIQANSRTSNSTVRFRKNGTNGSQSASVIASTTGTFQDAVNSDTVAATDLTCVVYVTGTGTAAQTVTSFGAQYNPASGCCTKYLAYNNGIAPAFSSASATYHGCLAGSWTTIFGSGSDADARYPVRAPGTFSNFFMNVSTNTRTTSTTLGIRKTGAAGNSILSIATTVTGTFEDSSNTDTVSSSDYVSVYAITGSDTSHSLAVRWGGAYFTSSGSSSDLVGWASTSRTRSTASNTYAHLTGDWSGAATLTEALCQDVLPFACRLSNLRVRASLLNTAGTWTLRVNGANGNQSVSTTSSGSGVFEDATHHDDIMPNDKIAVQCSSAAATASNYGGCAITVSPQPAVVSGTGSGLLQIAA